MARRHELAQARWETIRDRLAGKPGDPGRTAADNRLFVNAVLFVARTDIPRADLPERFGRPDSAWKRFDRWCRAGMWAELAGVPGEPDLAELHLDSTSVKAHPSAATSRRRPGKKRPMRTTGGARAAAAAD